MGFYSKFLLNSHYLSELLISSISTFRHVIYFSNLLSHTKKTVIISFTRVSRGCTFSALNTVYCYDKKCRPASCSCRRRGNGKARSEITYRELWSALSNVSHLEQSGRGFCHFLAYFWVGEGERVF